MSDQHREYADDPQERFEALLRKYLAPANDETPESRVLHIKNMAREMLGMDAREPFSIRRD